MGRMWSPPSPASREQTGPRLEQDQVKPVSRKTSPRPWEPPQTPAHWLSVKDDIEGEVISVRSEIKPDEVGLAQFSGKNKWDLKRDQVRSKEELKTCLDSEPSAFSQLRWSVFQILFCVSQLRFITSSLETDHDNLKRMLCLDGSSVTNLQCIVMVTMTIRFHIKETKLMTTTSPLPRFNWLACASRAPSTHPSMTSTWPRGARWSTLQGGSLLSLHASQQISDLWSTNFLTHR